MTSVITDETWALIAPRRSERRRLSVTAAIVAVMAVLAVTLWWIGAAVPRLSATPTLVEPTTTTGRVRLHVDLRNEGLIQAGPSSISPGTTLPVRSIEPHHSGGPDAPADLLLLPREGWTLSGGTHRPLVLELDVPCGSATHLWRLEMVAFGPNGSTEVRIFWKDGPLPDWRRTVVDTACG
jgi:hypothetical protein